MAETNLGTFYSVAAITFAQERMYTNTFLMHSIEDRMEAARKAHRLVHPKNDPEAKTDIFLRRYSLVLDILTNNIALVCDDRDPEQGSWVDLDGPTIAKISEEELN